MSGVSLVDVCKTYKNGYQAVKHFNLEIRENEFIIFVGPSGCGKSTTLRMIAGLEDISEGELWIDDQLMNMVEPKNRNLSMVFQNYALYPHMTVYQNMAFGLQVQKEDKKEIDRRVHEAAKILEIEHLLDRKPGALSGGQKQRVAIGSVIVKSPKVFLMDEPLSNLDAKLRTQMRVELAKIHRQLKTTIIYVTHDQVEAMTLGTRIVVMKDGEIQQVASPAELYRNPVNRFVAGFIGSPAMNFFTAAVKTDEQGTYLKVGEEILHMPPVCSLALKNKGYVGKNVILGIRPEDMQPEDMQSEEMQPKDMSPADMSAGNPDTGNMHPENRRPECLHLQDRNSVWKKECLSMKVEVREMLGAEVLLHGTLAGETAAVKAKPSCRTQVGDTVFLSVDVSNIKIFDEVTEKNILYV